MKLKFLGATFLTLVFVFWPLTVAQADSPGLTVEVYTYDPSALPDRQPYTLCETATVWTSAANINTDFDGEFGGIVGGCQGDFVLMHYSGFLTAPVSADVIFQSWADDGFYLSLDGVSVIDNWTLKGCGGGQGVFPMSAGQSYKLDAWFYEFGGGACNHLFWDLRDGQGMNVVPDSAYTTAPAVPVEPPVVVPPVQVLNAPVISSYVVDGTSVTLNWNAPVEGTVPLEHYTLMWTYGDNPGWGVGTTDSSFYVSGLPENTEVKFWLRSDNDSLHVYSPFGNAVSVTTATNPVVVPPVEPPIPPVVVPPVVIPDPPVVIPPVIPDPPVVPDPPYVPAPTPPTPNETLTDLVSVAPTDLTDAQVAQLQQVAYQVLDSVPENSPEYAQALDALYVAAQADDIQVDPSIASIPGVGAVAVGLTNAINLIGNIGSDMSPAHRATAKKEVVAAVVVTQVAVGASGMATQASIASSGGAVRKRD